MTSSDSTSTDETTPEQPALKIIHCWHCYSRDLKLIESNQIQCDRCDTIMPMFDSHTMRHYWPHDAQVIEHKDLASGVEVHMRADPDLDCLVVDRNGTHREIVQEIGRYHFNG